MRETDSFSPERQGNPVLWACRQALLWVGVGFGAFFLINGLGPMFGSRSGPTSKPEIQAAADPAGQIHNTLVYHANAHGQVELDGAVDATPVHFVVDTGATLVTLTMADAAAAGFGQGDLNFTLGMNTANGRVAAAPVTLRSVRIGQLELDDVPAAVVPNLSVSLLGMSFLSRLDHWEMQGNALTISY